jgi:Cys-tRNA(Pro)/Cys-tRNA(Cys) deacylase
LSPGNTIKNEHKNKALNITRPRLANPLDILELTGVPVGGVPSFGFKSVFLVDPKVAAQTYIFTGGGSPQSLLKIAV